MFEYSCTVVRVVDGDTVDVDIDLGFGVVLAKQRIRLFGLDAPESRTRDLEEKAYGLLAKRWLEEALDRGPVRLRSKQFNKGKYGRILGEFISCHGGGSINELMIADHQAVQYYGQSKEDIALKHLENRKCLSKIFQESQL